MASRNAESTHIVKIISRHWADQGQFGGGGGAIRPIISHSLLPTFYHPRNNLREVFFGRGKIGGGGDLKVVLGNEGKFWYKVPCCCFLVDGCCYFLAASGWLLIFPDWLWMVAVIYVSSMLRIHTACSAQKTHPSCSPCMVHTF